MLKQLTLKNFRQHTDLTVNFTEGLNVIRGANEAGKSTINEAINYAFRGANGLREPLGDVVTWGLAQTKLSVNLVFAHSSVDYAVSRSSAGAELTFGNERVTGQTEVTNYISKLFGADPKVIQKVQLAAQGKIQGALAEGATATVELIESLSDMSVLDDLVTKIQEQRPCGATNAVQAAIAGLSMPGAAHEPPDFGPVERASRAVSGALYALESVCPGPDAAQVAAARERIAQARSIELQNKARAVELAKLKEFTAPVGLNYTAADVQGWREELAQAENTARLRKEYLREMPVIEHREERQAFTDKQANTLKLLQERKADIQFTRDKLIKLKATRINEKTCSLCRKDLSDVPEVIVINNDVDTKALALEKWLQQLEEEKAQLEDAKKQQEAIATLDLKLNLQFSQDYWTHDLSVIPRKLVWQGEPPKEIHARVSKESIAVSEKALAAYLKTVTVYQTAQARMVELAVDLSVPETAEAEDVLLEDVKAQYRLTAARNTLAEVKLTYEQAKNTYALAEQAYKHSLQLEEKRKEQLAKAKLELDQMTFWNELIKKIRNARPAVASKLWNLVLAAVSHYFSQARGKPSIATRERNKFLVDGKGTAGLAGSALDVLGLSIRLALGKTFMPYMDFILLDEPAAACSEERELQMLGMLASAGITQTILVTHSNLADALAENLIQL